MLKVCGIYKITNKLNNKIYIGQSTNIHRRWLEHKRLASKDVDFLIGKAINKYGVENFSIELLEMCNSDDLDKREITYIEKLNSTNSGIGYNLSTGGQGSPRTTDKLYNHYKEITSYLQGTEYSMRSIATMFNTHCSQISKINTGKRWYQDDMNYPIRNKVTTDELYCSVCGKPLSSKGVKMCKQCYLDSQSSTIPSKEELLKVILDANYNKTKASLVYGVSATTIKDWCVKYDIPHTRSRIIRNNPNNYGLPKEVAMLNISTKEVIKVFTSLAEAAKEFGSIKSASHISRVCSGERKQAFGYTWKFIK